MDFCEENYEVSASIAEFYNAISTAPFFLLPPLLFRLNLSYERRFGDSCSMLSFWLLLPLVGIASAYYHATLSFAGRQLDYLSIFWFLSSIYYKFPGLIFETSGWRARWKTPFLLLSRLSI